MPTNIEGQKTEHSTYVASVSPTPSPESDDLNNGVQTTRFSSIGPLARLHRYEAFLDQKLGVEAHGPDRKLPDKRNPPNQWVVAALRASGTMNLSCFITGFLGWDFGLSLSQTYLIAVFSTPLGSIITR
ncbi:hypothetical protein MMC32_003142 [Xylographa parallela]|nr:hypothetical protein [Xylographa parallela]